MNEYTFAIEFWSAVVGVLALLPFSALVAKETFHATMHLLHHDSHDSLASIPSAPRPSRP